MTHPANTSLDVIVLQDRLREMEKTANQAAECHAQATRRADAAEKRIAELEAELAEVKEKLAETKTELEIAGWEKDDWGDYLSELMHMENGQSV